MIRPMRAGCCTPALYGIGVEAGPRAPSRRPFLRVRCCDHRLIYAVDDQARTVTVAAVGHRREVYRSLDL